MGRTLASYKKLFEELRRGKIADLYFLYGSEEYIKKEFVSELIARALPEGARSFNLNLFYGDDFDRHSFEDRFNSYPLFAQRRLVIVKDFDALPAPGKDAVVACCRRVPSGLTLVVESSVSRMDNVRLKALKEAAAARGVCFEFKHLSEEETLLRVRERLKRQGIGIDPDALDLLVQCVGTELMDLINEVEKLVLFVGDGNVITRKAVAGVVGKYRLENVFGFLDSIGLGSAGQTLRALDAVLKGGEEPVFVVAMALRRVLLLLQLKEVRTKKGKTPKDLAARLGISMSPYFLSRLIDQARRVDREQLAVTFTNLIWADLSLKSTTINPRIVLEEAFLASSERKSLAHPRV